MPEGIKKDHQESGLLSRPFSRRRLLRRAVEAVAVGIVARPAASAAINAFYLYVMGRSVAIPDRLRGEIPVVNGSAIVGIGDSYEAGVRGDDRSQPRIPLSQRIGERLQQQGVDVVYADGAVVGSPASDIPRQLARIVPRNRNIALSIWTGHNTIENNTYARRFAKEFARNPFSLASLEYPSVRKNILDSLEKEFEEALRSTLSQPGVIGAHICLPAPIQYAPRILELNGVGATTAKVPIAGDGLSQKVLQAAIADLVFGAGQRIVKIAIRLQKEGNTIVVTDPQQVMGRRSYKGSSDEHPNGKAYDQVANLVRRKFRRRNSAR